jgi:hypothetical protein
MNSNTVAAEQFIVDSVDQNSVDQTGGELNSVELNSVEQPVQTKKKPVAKTIPKKIMGYLKFACFVLGANDEDIVSKLFLEKSIEQIIAIVNDVVENGNQDKTIQLLRKQVLNPPKPKKVKKTKKTDHADAIVADLVNLARTDPLNTTPKKSRAKKVADPTAQSDTDTPVVEKKVRSKKTKAPIVVESTVDTTVVESTIDTTVVESTIDTTVVESTIDTVVDPVVEKKVRSKKTKAPIVVESTIDTIVEEPTVDTNVDTTVDPAKKSRSKKAPAHPNELPVSEHFSEELVVTDPLTSKKGKKISKNSNHD